MFDFIWLPFSDTYQTMCRVPDAVSYGSMEHGACMTQASPEPPVIKAYWQPGCTSCLRLKEFLTKHGVAFVSVNVLEDRDALAELAALGIRSVPLVRGGDDWRHCQVL